MPKLIDSYLTTIDYFDIITSHFFKIILVFVFFVITFWEGDTFLMIADLIDFFYDSLSLFIMLLSLVTFLRGRVEIPRIREV